MDKLIGVIAGTPIDTAMGVDLLISRGYKSEGYPISGNAKEQARLQLISKDILYEEVLIKIKEAKMSGVEGILVYCNSLSAAVDMDKMSIEMEIPIITPFSAYKDFGEKYSSILLLAANAQSCDKIETILERTNEDIKIWSISALPLVEEIERDISPEEIFKTLKLNLLLEWSKSNRLEAIILGCTHFPYIANILKENTDLYILDPSEKMIEELNKI